MNTFKNRVNQFIKSQDIHLEDDVFEYGYTIVSKYVIVLLIVLLVSIWLDTCVETIIFLFVFVSLRQYLGGFHLNVKVWCLMFSIGIMILLPFGCKYVGYVDLILRMVSLVIIILIMNFIGVVDHKNKRLTNKEKKRFIIKANKIFLGYSIIVLVFYSILPLSYSNTVFLSLEFMSLNSVVGYVLNQKNN